MAKFPADDARHDFGRAEAGGLSDDPQFVLRAPQKLKRMLDAPVSDLLINRAADIFYEGVVQAA